MSNFWIDDVPNSPVEEPTAPLGGEPIATRSAQLPVHCSSILLCLLERNGEQAPMTPDRRERPNLGHSGQGRGVGIGSPGFGGGVSVYFDEARRSDRSTPLGWNLH